jgi:hypothetical protein
MTTRDVGRGKGEGFRDRARQDVALAASREGFTAFAKTLPLSPADVSTVDTRQQHVE